MPKCFAQTMLNRSRTLLASQKTPIRISKPLCNYPPPKPCFRATCTRNERYPSSTHSQTPPQSCLFGVPSSTLPAGPVYFLGFSQMAFLSTKAGVMQTPARPEHLEARQVRGRGQTVGQKSQATLMYLVALVVAMVGCSYASVPLYRKFCQATGYGGTVQRRETVEEKIARHSEEDVGAARELVVQFNADVADGMPWRFTPSQREVRVKPGQSTLAFYTAENLSSKPITGVSTYNVSPMKAGIYFNKIQCFCFEEQRLLPGEKIDMPVFFYIDPEFATDPKLDGVNSLILSYTFFKVEDGKE